MCGRITQNPKLETLVAKYGARNHTELDLTPHYNGAPGQDFVAVRSKGGERVLEELRWGHIPSWAAQKPGAKRLINARCETVNEKPSFRSAFRARRCVIPVNGWFEWRPESGGKQPYWLRPEGADMFSLAGICRGPVANAGCTRDVGLRAMGRKRGGAGHPRRVGPGAHPRAEASVGQDAERCRAPLERARREGA